MEAEAPILWPPNAKSRLIGKDPDAGKVWGQEEKGMPEDEMVGWHHWLNGHEFEQAPGESEGQGSLACCGPWGHKELDTGEQPNNNEGFKAEESICPVLWGATGSMLYKEWKIQRLIRHAVLFSVVLDLRCCVWRSCALLFSSCLERGLLFSCRVQASHRKGFSRALGHAGFSRGGSQSTGSIAVVHKLSCPEVCGVSQVRDWAQAGYFHSTFVCLLPAPLGVISWIALLSLLMWLSAIYEQFVSRSNFSKCPFQFCHSETPCTAGGTWKLSHAQLLGINMDIFGGCSILPTIGWLLGIPSTVQLGYNWRKEGGLGEQLGQWSLY